MEICGKWKLISVEQLCEYCDAIGTAAEHKDKATQLLTPANNITQNVCVQDDTVTIVTGVPGKEIEVKAKLGESTDGNFLDGRPLKSVFTVEDGTLREEQTGSFTSTNLRYREGANMVMKMTSNGVSSIRKYEKV